MITKKTKVIIGSLSAICVASSLLAGGTYSLLHKEVIVHNHLETAGIKMKLTRSELEYGFYGENGYEEVTVLTDGSIHEGDIVTNPEIDFTNDSTHSIFADLSKNETDIKGFAPGLYREVSMSLYSESPIAFDYYVEFKFSTDATSDENLAKQIKITFTADSYSTSFTLDEMTQELKDNGNNLKKVTASNEANFSVRIEFLNDEDPNSGLQPGDNNLVVNKEVNFDMIVHATQSLN